MQCTIYNILEIILITNVLTAEQMNFDNFLYACPIRRKEIHILLDFIPQITYKDYQRFEATTNEASEF